LTLDTLHPIGYTLATQTGEKMEQYISTREARELTGYTEAHVRELARDKKIESKKIGQAVLIDRKSLLVYAKKMKDLKK
jgi:excisionase family DNA binding protein